MTHTRLWIAATIIAAIILGGFILSVPHTHDVMQPEGTGAAPVTTPIVKVHDVYRKGTHTLTGTIEAPNPCTTLSANAALTGDASSTQAIAIMLTMPEDTGICVQQAVSLSFSATVAAPAETPITASVNGVPATVTSI
jgi:hypothetical protein